MTYVPIPPGTLNWDVPVNSAFTGQDSRITDNSNSITTNTTNITALQGQMTTAISNIATNTTNITTLQGQMTSVTTTANAAVPKDTQVINVKDHGATGGGAVDDTAAINTSIGLLSAGGVVYFPPGSYLLNGSTVVTLPANVTLRGAGPGASLIVIGASFSGAQAINVTGINAGLADLTIKGASSTTTSNPVTFGVASVNNQNFKVTNCAFRFINGYAIKAWGDTTTTTAGGTTLHGGAIVNTNIESCAGGIHIKTTNGGSISSVWPANFRITDLFTRSLGVSTGGSANLDGVRIEDSGDVIMENAFTWMGQSSSGTGVALRVVGNCAATFITNLDALGPVTGPNVSIEGNANGSPQNVQITGGVIQQGSVGINIQDASTQIRLVSVRILNNQTHGATVSTTGPAIYFDGCFFSLNGQGATGTNYDLNWSGTTTGFVTNCRFASPIVAVSSIGVQFSVNVTAGQNVRFFNSDFQGTGGAVANWFTAFPAYATTNNAVVSGDTTGRFAFLTDVNFSYTTGPGRVSIQPFAAGNNCFSTNVQGTDANDRFRLLGSGDQQFGPGTAGRDTTWGRRGTSIVGTSDSDIEISTVGKGLRVKGGTNGRVGTATLVAGTVTVAVPSITANSRVMITRRTSGGTAGTLTYTISAGASFTVTSSSGTDTSVVDYFIVEQF